MSRMKKKELESMLDAIHQALEETKAENKKLQADNHRLIAIIENLTSKK